MLTLELKSFISSGQSSWPRLDNISSLYKSDFELRLLSTGESFRSHKFRSSEAAHAAIMDDSSSIDGSEEFRQRLFGTAEQARQFRQWIAETNQPLSLDNVNRWLSANIGILLDDEYEAFIIVREALEHIARDLQKKYSPNATIRLPGYGLPLEWLPHTGPYCPVLLTNDGLQWGAAPLLIRELCMLKAMEEITDKPDWWKNVRDAHTAECWKREILALDWSKYMKYADFTSSMAEQCIQELKLTADLYEKTGLIPVFDNSACVIKSDKVVSHELKKAFAGIATELKYVDNYSSLHNGGLMVRQAHNSLFPLIYGRSQILPNRTIKLHNCLEACGQGDTIPRPRDPGLDAESRFRLYDNSYQWLPFDVTISKNGNARIDSYINNLHPVKNKKLYSIISKAINHALPAWDIVYLWPRGRFGYQRFRDTDLMTTCEAPPGIEYERRVMARAQRTNKDNATQAAIEASMDTAETSRCQNYPALSLTLEHNESDAIVIPEEPSIPQWLIDTHPIELPEPHCTMWRQFFIRPSDVKSSGFFLPGNKRIQVMVTFEEIRLTPENPDYGGDIWRTDGQLNEHIVSTAMFCYNVQNITDNYIYFGAVAHGVNLDPHSHSMPREVTLRAYGVNPEENNFQVLGRVRVHPDNAIFYPNVYKHRHGPFSLADRSKNGHLKYFKLYLVDPAIPIISTANVPPQQYDWWTECKIHNQGLDIVQRLPPELKEIVNSYVDFPIDGEEESKIHREIELHREELGDNLHLTPWYAPMRGWW
ncbi:hypothetical protein MKX08_002467 [Trichoderma sp. CBMAI-0020]|nr:hypothetical protein MKX08_002467 [Trichoderma sp. CBMAI-0020]